MPKMLLLLSQATLSDPLKFLVGGDFPYFCFHFSLEFSVGVRVKP